MRDTSMRAVLSCLRSKSTQLASTHLKTKRKKTRNWRVFIKREFAEELSNTNWDAVSDVNANTNTSFSNFYKKVTNLLDEMAPLRTPTKREIRLQQKPWITSGILKSMAKRDIFHKEFTKEKNPLKIRKTWIYL